MGHGIDPRDTPHKISAYPERLWQTMTLWYLFESYERKPSIATPISPGRGGQTEVTPDQTSFERTHVPGALELHGLEKASSALLSGQWSGTCLIRGHFVLGRSDQRSLWSGTVWSEAVSSAHKSDQRPIRAHTSLTRDQFKRHFLPIFFLFS